MLPKLSKPTSRGPPNIVRPEPADKASSVIHYYLSTSKNYNLFYLY